MIVIKAKDLQYVPASHEDQTNPEVWKKILFKKEDLTDGHIQMINWAKLPVGKSFRTHYHEDMDEIFIILNGRTAIQVNNDEGELDAGDAVVTPMRCTHKLTNISNEDVMYIVIGISRGQNGKTIVVEK